MLGTFPTRPTLSIFGDMTLKGDQNTPRYLPYGEQVDHAIQLGLLNRNDPRTTLDPNEIRGLGLRSLEGLQRAASNAYAIQRSEDRMQTKDSTDKASIVLAAIALSMRDTPETADTDPGMGKAGILARRLEEAALRIATTYPNDPNVKRLLTVAAASHTVGAMEASTRGLENGSIVEAAATQKRDPMAVMADLIIHGKLDPADPRRALREADLDLTPDQALERIRPQRPQAVSSTDTEKTDTGMSNRLSMARRAEGRAMAMVAQTDGSTFDQTTRKEAAHQLLAAAFAAERHRQQAARAAALEAASTPAPAKRTKLFGNDSR
jgi:hypothetical protein